MAWDEDGVGNEGLCQAYMLGSSFLGPYLQLQPFLFFFSCSTLPCVGGCSWNRVPP